MEEEKLNSKFTPKTFADLSEKEGITQSEIDNMTEYLFHKEKNNLEEDIEK